jgi:uncharacterized membrane protein YhdT
MNKRTVWSRILCVIGLVALLIGALDPLEGAFVIVPASAVIALSAFLARSRFRRCAYWAFGLTASGVGALFIISALGGVGGPAGGTGRSMWWLLTCLPYPLGWILCLYAVVRILSEGSDHGESNQSRT